MKSFFSTIVRVFRERDFLAKLASLLLAVVLWGYITTSKSDRLTFKIPIEQKDLPAQLVISQMSNRNVNVTLEGKKELLRNFNSKNIRAYVNLNRPRIGELKKYPLMIVKQRVPESVTIRLSPNDVDIKVERVEEKWVRVLPRFKGEIKAGTVIGRMKIVPDRVLITGASSFLGKVEYLYTEDIDLGGLSGDVVKQTEIKKEDLEDITFSQTAVKVTFSVSDSSGVTSLTLPLSLKHTEKGYKYVCSGRDVVVFLKNGKYSASDLEAFIDVAPLKGLLEKSGKKAFERDMAVTVRSKDEQNAEVVSALPEKMTIKIFKSGK